MKYLLIILITLSIYSCQLTKTTSYRKYDYKIDITDSGSYIYQKKRFVGFVPLDTTDSFYELFNNDNF